MKDFFGSRKKILIIGSVVLISIIAIYGFTEVYSYRKAMDEFKNRIEELANKHNISDMELKLERGFETDMTTQYRVYYKIINSEEFNDLSKKETYDFIKALQGISPKIGKENEYIGSEIVINGDSYSYYDKSVKKNMTEIHSERIEKSETSTTKVEKNLSPSEVYYWIQNRYEKYEELYDNGEYTDEKYNTEVFLDAADYFGTSISEVRKAYDSFSY